MLKSEKNLNRICPVCHCKTGNVLHTQKFALSDNHILPKVYDVVACSVCGFVFADTTAGQVQYDVFYRDFSKYEDLTISSGGGLCEWDKNRLSEAAKWIDNAIDNKSASILDIGCANGGLLNEMRKLSYDNLTCIDPSPSCVIYVSNIGIECFNGSLFNYAALPADKKYDCIFLSHVLEHVYDLDRAIVAVTKILNPHGFLYIEVPDASRYSEYYIAPFSYFDIEHINHFDESSLLNLFRNEGYIATKLVKKVIQVSSTNQYPAIGLLLRISAKDIITRPNKILNDSACKDIKAYISMSLENDYHDQIDALANSNEAIIIWGAGSYTLRLLETTLLGKCVINAFVDSDKSKQGQDMYGKPIVSPESLVNIPTLCPIVVCSALYSTDILHQIYSMNIQNRVLIA